MGERPFSGQGRLLRGLSAEVNCRKEEKRKKEKEGRERESSMSGPTQFLPTNPAV